MRKVSTRVEGCTGEGRGERMEKRMKNMFCDKNWSEELKNSVEEFVNEKLSDWNCVYGHIFDAGDIIQLGRLIDKAVSESDSTRAYVRISHKKGRDAPYLQSSARG